LPAASNGLPGSRRRGPRRGRLATPVLLYVAFLRVGLAVPRASPSSRWALTPPFHPCPIRPLSRTAVGGLLSVALSPGLLPPGLAPGGLPPPPCPADPGLPSEIAPRGRPVRTDARILPAGAVPAPALGRQLLGDVKAGDPTQHDDGFLRPRVERADFGHVART